MKSRLLAVCAISALAALCVACSKISTQTTTTQTGNPWTIHGVLRVAALDEPDNLNPMVGNQQAEVDLSLLWGAYLFRFNNDNEWIPELATRVPTLENGDISKDGLEIIYHLRNGVNWQDGVPFGADDVIFSWRQIMNPRNNVASRVGYDDIAGIDKLDIHTIRVRLHRPYAPFLSAFFSMGGTPIEILPKHLLAQYQDLNRVPYNNHPIGTGPFIVERYDHGSMIKFVANPNYFRGAPKIKEIDWHFIPDANTVMTQLRTHEIDAEFAMPYEYVPTLQTIPGIRLYRTPLTAYDQIALNLTNPVLADRTVRQALAYGLDRVTLLKKVYHNTPLLADSDQPTFLWAHDPNLKQYNYNPQLAARMLEADGWKVASDGYRYKNGQRLRLELVTTPTGSGSDSIFVQQNWKAIGVDISIKIVSGPIFFATYGGGGTLQTGKFDVAFLGWFNGADPDDSTQFMCNQFPPAGQDFYHFCNQELDAQEKIALASNDIRTRKAAYYKIQEILVDEEPTIFMYFVRRVSALNTDFKNFKPSHAVSLLWNPWEWEI